MRQPLICEVGGSGMLLPLFGDDEQTWPKPLRAVFYCLCLGWCFLGVALASDAFMSAIERITSRKVRKLNPRTNRYVTVLVWNATVANLTLMALGSSAPEIMLSVIEVLQRRFISGDLGPSTIVGSGAFNLLAIVAICILSIPAGEVRAIQNLSVYYVTAAFSIFAYLWLLFILVLNSENVITITEAVITLLFLPILVCLAFAADKGWLSATSVDRRRAAVTSDMSLEEIAELSAELQQRYDSKLEEKQIIEMIDALHASNQSRAVWRNVVTRSLLTSWYRKVPQREKRSAVVPFSEILPQPQARHSRKPSEPAPMMGFQFPRISVLESMSEVKIRVVRRSSVDLSLPIRASYSTREGTAKADEDFRPASGILEIKSGMMDAFISVRIIDDNSFEDDECFYIDLLDCETGSVLSTTTVVIIDDDGPGCLRFVTPEVSVHEGVGDTSIGINVDRVSGSNNRVWCSYYTEDVTAIAGVDYDAAEGTLYFEEGQIRSSLNVTIKESGRYDRTDMFRVILRDAGGGARFDAGTDGGEESCISYVIIQASKESRSRIERLKKTMNSEWSRAAVGRANWREQIVRALQVNAEEEEDDDEASSPSKMDWAMHIVSLPWKILVALLPPTAYLNGWACFVCALGVVGFVTGIVGDLAALLGCVMTIPDEITAITLVALGTSLPDAFASRMAAVEDPTADASVGNVTGSNSVNVFLGLGLPWTMGSVYWKVNGANPEWLEKYENKDWLREHNGAVFVVEAGSLAFSVKVFSCCAVSCIGLLAVRRKFAGGELGGSTRLKRLSGAVLVSLWAVYVILSSWAALR